MPRIRHLTSAVAIALAFSSAAQAQDFSGFVVFGDSLSDAGQYAPFIPGAGSFTTNPDPVWAEILGTDLGFTMTPSDVGGTDFAWGGAPTSAPFVCVPTTLPCRNGSQQLGDYFTATGGAADPHALYAVWLGANNIFNALANPATAQASVGLSVQQNVGLIGALQNAGAKYIVVVNLPDIGATPFGTSLGPSGSASVSQLINIYNAGLNSGLAQLGDGIIPVDAYGLVNDVLADPNLY
jgi:outer membrane lipase/esterase